MKVEDASKKKLYNEAVNKQNKSHRGLKQLRCNEKKQKQQLANF